MRCISRHGRARTLALVSIVAGSACSGKLTNIGCGSTKDEYARLPGDDIVMAKVGETPISEYDVSRAIKTSLGGDTQLTPDAHKKVLESLITSRALALARERELAEQDRGDLDKAVARYREQLLVEQYIAEHFPPTPISSEAIAHYYKEHAESFGARTVHTFELLTLPLPADGQNQELLASLTSAAQSADWKAAAAKSAGPGKVAIEYQSGSAQDSALHPRLRHALANLTLNQASSTLLIDRRAYVLRVTGENKTEPRPLPEVADTIRKSLAAQALKTSVAKASDEVRKRTNIEYRGAK